MQNTSADKQGGAMDFSLTEEQDLIRDAVRKVCENFSDEYWAQKDADHEFPWDFYNTMSEAGWIGIAIPKPMAAAAEALPKRALYWRKLQPLVRR